MRTSVVFDGHELTELAIVSDLRTTLAQRELRTEDVAGRDGTVFTGACMSARDIVLMLSVMGRSIEERRVAARELAAILSVDTPRRLSISVDGGLYYMAIPTTDGDTAIMTNADRFEVRFLCPDPYAYGKARTVTAPSGGTVTFEVGGTHSTRPLIDVPSAKAGSDGFWRLRMEDGSFVMARLQSATQAHHIIIDCQSRTMSVDGSVAMLDPMADWLSMTPGSHTFEMTGTGAATVTFDERWI